MFAIHIMLYVICRVTNYENVLWSGIEVFKDSNFVKTQIWRRRLMTTFYCTESSDSFFLITIWPEHHVPETWMTCCISLLYIFSNSCSVYALPQNFYLLVKVFSPITNKKPCSPVGIPSSSLIDPLAAGALRQYRPGIRKDTATKAVGRARRREIPHNGDC